MSEMKQRGRLSSLNSVGILFSAHLVLSQISPPPSDVTFVDEEPPRISFPQGGK